MFCVCFFFIHDSCYLLRCQNIKSDHNFTISLRVWILCHELMHSIHSLQFVLILSGKASGSTVLAGTFCISFIFCIVFCRLVFVFSFFSFDCGVVYLSSICFSDAPCCLPTFSINFIEMICVKITLPFIVISIT